MFRIIDSTLEYFGPEPRTAIEAIELSIEKWEFIAENGPVQCGGTSTCGLCMLFIDDECKDCPVTKRGKSYCRNTPYQRYELEMERTRPDQDEAIRAAEEEIEFLESLKEEIECQS
jgi:hypothetical protein